jgi:aldose 1-epimerase
MTKLLLPLLLPLMTQAANYSILKTSVDGIDVVQLFDAGRHTEVSIVPSIGNMAYEMKVNGKNILWFPFQHLAELKERPALCGVPFLAPWANRIDGDTYYANGKKYALNPELGNLRRDQNGKPIHGVLSFSPEWKLVSAAAGSDSAHATSRLEFWKHPEMMAQFPFAHTITMTYRLANGVLEVETTIENHSAAAMPVAIGYHPYLRLYDTPRDRWKVGLAAREHVVLNSQLMPAGERKPLNPSAPLELAGMQLDDVYTGLVRGNDGRAQFWVAGEKEKIAVSYGPKYPVAVVYAPPGRDFICFEPMAAVTNAFNLAHAGKYGELQSVPAHGQWKESFWIAPIGF